MTDMRGDGVVAALTLVDYPRAAVAGALLHMGMDRLVLRRTAGLRFWQLLGTSRGLAAGRWEPRRYGLFTVWDGAAALEAFEAHSPVMGRYREVANESWTLRLVPMTWHGRWGGVDPFEGVPQTAGAFAGPLVVLTRARLRLRHIAAFRQTSSIVTTRLAEQPGLVASFGLGEIPLVLQATISLWRDARSVQQFAYGSDEHRSAINRTHHEHWYSEELFARLRPVGSSGSWGGVDPFANAVAAMTESKDADYTDAVIGGGTTKAE
ncbi:MAG: hypothetical protein NVS2B7_39460 [Herpetosiphon sp.]